MSKSKSAYRLASWAFAFMSALLLFLAFAAVAYYGWSEAEMDRLAEDRFAVLALTGLACMLASVIAEVIGTEFTND